MEKIVFYFPWKEVSGGPFYLTRIANDLAKLKKYEVYYTDYVHGLADTLLEDLSIHKLEYHAEGKNFEVFLNEPIILVMPIYWFSELPKLHKNSKIVFFNWHNECLTALKNAWKVDDDAIYSFLNLVKNTNSVFFCDKTHQLAQNINGLEFNETFVPITIPKREVIAKRDLIMSDQYNIAILGRLSPDKVYAAIDLLDNIMHLRLEKIINIYVIGQGVCENMLFDKWVPDNVNIIKCGTMKIHEVIKLLENKVDILFAMGTSVLDGASIRLPSVIIPNDVKTIKCNKYAFLYQSSGYALGWAPSQIDKLGIEYCSIKEIFEKIYVDRQKDFIGQKCYDYYMEHHVSNIEQFVNAIDLSTLTNFKIQEFLKEMKTKKYYLKKILGKVKETFGIIQKKIVILGIPILIISRTNEEHFNVYFFMCPLFRINKNQSRISIHLLLAVWIYKFIKKYTNHLLNCVQFRKSTKKIQIKLEEKMKIDNARRNRIDKKILNGEKIRICIFESRIGCWQFSNLYNILQDSGRFEPIIVVIPFLTMGQQAMIEYMEQTYIALCKEGFRVVRGYNDLTHKYIDIKNELDPDAVFYSTFWKNHFHENSYINKFENIYSFLYPYGYDIVSHHESEAMNFELQNKVTRYYLPTKIHKLIAEDNMNNKGSNVFITGSPKLDFLLDKNYIPKKIWKGKKEKRIIWAPHHTLCEAEPNYQLCAFLTINEFMLELTKRYKDKIVFAFKPHPMLKYRLIHLWGKERTEDYYNKWKFGENTQLEEGEFFDLFLTSDAMILDSISFIAEYTVINKPAFFTLAEDSRFYLNKFGREIYKVLYKNCEPETLELDIIEFIERVVLKGIDTKFEERSDFINTFMLPENNKTAAENIYEDMSRVMLEDIYQEYKVSL